MNDTAPRATASALPPAVARSPIIVRYDLIEAADDIRDAIDDLRDDASNAAQAEHQVNAAIAWIRELFAELRAVPR